LLEALLAAAAVAAPPLASAVVVAFHRQATSEADVRTAPAVQELWVFDWASLHEKALVVEAAPRHCVVVASLRALDRAQLQA
jgi:hypothetical protein